MPPKFIRPCIPTTAKAIPVGDAWLHEPKLGGYHFQIVKDGRPTVLLPSGAQEDDQMTTPNRLSPSRRQLVVGAVAAATSGLVGGFPQPAFAKAPMVGLQAPGFYRSKLGAFEITVVSDGPLPLGEPKAGIFGAVSKEDFGRMLGDNYMPTDKSAGSRRRWSISTSSSRRSTTG